jgi:uncharacterized RDD family membrane protein YckC
MNNVESINWTLSDLAHPGKRYQAQFLDGLVSLLLFSLCLYVSKSFNLSGQWVDVSIVAIPFAYFIFSDALPNGQSLGKIPLGIFVVCRSTRKPCSITQAFTRNVLSPALGFIDAILILGERRQRLGDRLANTVVIHRAANK